MRRVVASLILLASIGGAPALAGDEKERRDEWPPSYENPLMDLLFLPIKVLIRVGSVFEPKEEAGERSGTGETTRSQ